VSYLFLSPAKINLDFKILGRREDGYHLIKSEMVAVSLFDFLEISINDQNILTSSTPLPFDFSTSIFFKVYHELKKRFSLLPFFKIHLKKNIPIGAGLGGGSSNAVTFIYAINQICKLQMDENEMSEIGKRIGADVPFFFSFGRALAEDIGTQITPLEAKDKDFYTLLFSDLSILTPQVYRSVNLIEIDHKAKNQLEKFALCAYPCYAATLASWRQFFPGVTMTGSGSSAFIKGLAPFSQHGFQGFHVRSLRRDSGEWYKPPFQHNTI